MSWTDEDDLCYICEKKTYGYKIEKLRFTEYHYNNKKKTLYMNICDICEPLIKRTTESPEYKFYVTKNKINTLYEVKHKDIEALYTHDSDDEDGDSGESFIDESIAVEA